MSQYSWFFVNKNYLLFAIVATALVIPVGFVVADIYWIASTADTATDGDTGFASIKEVSSVATWTNTTGDTDYAIVTGFQDNAVTVIDVSNPNAISGTKTLIACTIETFADATVCDTDGQNGVQLKGVRDVEVFTNTNGTFAVTVSNTDDAIQVLDVTAARDAIYPLLNYTEAAVGYNYGKVVLNGAYDVAIFDNSTTAGGAPMAIVASNIEDGVQVFNLRNVSSDDDEDTPFLYPGLNRTATGVLYGVGAAGDRMPLDGASAVATFTATGKTASAGTIPFAIVTAYEDDAIQILTLRDPMNSSGANTMGRVGTTGYYNAAGIRAPMNATGPSPYSNATDTAAGANLHDCETCTGGGYKLLNGAVDVDTWTYGDQTYGIIVAQLDKAFTIINLTDPTFSTGGISAAQLYNTTDGSQYPALDGVNSVDVFKIDSRPYALMTSNNTDNAVTLVDLYQATNPQPVLVVRDDIEGFNLLNGANDVVHLNTNGEHYAIVVAGGGAGGATSTSASSVTMVQLSGDKPSSGGAGICGMTADCSPPSITKHGNTPTTDGFSINGKNIPNQDKYNDVDTVNAKVGQLVKFKARIADDFSVNSIERVNFYFDMQGATDWSYSDASIAYNVKSGSVTVKDPNGLFEGDVSAQVSENPYGDDPQLALLDVTFKVLFNNPMDASHIAVQSIDDMNNYQIIYFKDAIEVTGTPTQTSAEETIEGEVTQTVATVPEWVKNTAGWWAEGAISEGEFVKGVEYLIKQQIIDTDVQTTTSEGTGASVPEWVKNTAGWWADGAISENEFVNAIEHLVKTGTIIVI